MPASGNTWSAAASPPSTATATASPTCCWPAAQSPAKFYRNASTRGGALRFEAAESGLELDAVTGAYPLDIDSDGITDLVLLRVGENVVMRGLGDCRFERANEAWGFDGGDAWSTAFAATWEQGADWPTHRHRQLYRPQRGHVALGLVHRQLAAPARVDDGERTLRRAAAAEAELSARCRCCSPTGTARARPSLRVSNDREYYEGGQEQLWHVEPGKPPALYTEAEGWKLLRIWGMGIASYDLDFDGYPEYFLTSMADNKLQTLAAIPADGHAASRPIATSPSPRASPRTAPIPAATCAPEHGLARAVRGRQQ